MFKGPDVDVINNLSNLILKGLSSQKNNQEKYLLFACDSMVGLLCMCFIRMSLLSKITNIRTNQI